MPVEHHKQTTTKKKSSVLKNFSVKYNLESLNFIFCSSILSLFQKLSQKKSAGKWVMHGIWHRASQKRAFEHFKTVSLRSHKIWPCFLFACFGLLAWFGLRFLIKPQLYLVWLFIKIKPSSLKVVEFLCFSFIFNSYRSCVSSYCPYRAPFSMYYFCEWMLSCLKLRCGLIWEEGCYYQQVMHSRNCGYLVSTFDGATLWRALWNSLTLSILHDSPEQFTNLLSSRYLHWW